MFRIHGSRVLSTYRSELSELLHEFVGHYPRRLAGDNYRQIMYIRVILVDIRPVKCLEIFVIAAVIIKHRKPPIFRCRKHDMKNSLNCLEGEIVQPITYSDENKVKSPRVSGNYLHTD